MRTRANEAKSLQQNALPLVATALNVQADSKEVLKEYYINQIGECFRKLQILNIYDHAKEISTICTQVMAMQKEVKKMTRQGY